MCFFNRLRFKCGHTQTCIFQTCSIARHTRGRTYHTTCRPSKRSHRNVRTWDLLGSCENCLRLTYGRGYFPGIQGNGIGVPVGGFDEGYYPYYPATGGNHNHMNGYNPRYWDRGGNYFSRGHQISTLNPDECDEFGCMNINTPKDIQRGYQRSGYAHPYVSSRGLGMNNNRFLGMGMGYDDAGSYMYSDDMDGMGMGMGMGMSPELETAPLRMIEGVEGYDGYADGMGRRSPYVGRRGRVVPEAHMVD
ncbi:hypothetical protein TWF481_007839 [Arthrobotrys musiformis]|uniref:Uncharacterized protein n=1 Tax=Arthrobotrys musiformis TaxID=47236 RepID=A0AAV9W5I3_9PEZI